MVTEWAIEQDDEWITVPRAAELSGRSTRWVYDWAANHPGAYRKLPGRNGLRVRLGDLRQAVAHERGKRAGKEIR